MDKLFLLLVVAGTLAVVALLLKLRSRLLSPESAVSGINQLSAWAANNKAKVLSYTRVAQAAVGVFLMLLGYSMGREHFHLIRAGARTQGTIVGYKEQYFAGNYSRASSSGTTAFMPLVSFQAGDRVVQFKDWMGTKAAVMNVRVTVLYDPANPSVAMIDRPVWNWIPWAPTFAVGLFLLLVAMAAWSRTSQGTSPV